MYRLSIAALALAAATPALAGTTTNYQQRGEYFSASWYESGTCSSRYVSVGVYEDTQREGGDATTTTLAWASVSSYDFCAGTFTYYYGDLDAVSLQVGANSASLSGSGELYDYYTGAALPVAITATADNSGGSYHGVSVVQSTSPGQRYTLRSTGLNSYGAATIVVNDTTYTSSTGGSFGRSSSGTLTRTE